MKGTVLTAILTPSLEFAEPITLPLLTTGKCMQEPFWGLIFRPTGLKTLMDKPLAAILI